MNIISAPTSAHQDEFFALRCDNVPLSGVKIVFETTTAGDVAVEPNLLRPHLAFAATLPSSVPVGNHRVRLQAGTSSSNSVPVTVAGPPAGASTTIINPGEAKPAPYTIAFIANPAVKTLAGAFVADPILASRATFNNTVSFCLRCLFSFRDDLLYANGIDRRMRIVAIFDPGAGPSAANALAEEYSGIAELMAPRRDEIAAFLGARGVKADVAFALHDFAARPRAAAHYTSDDFTRGTVPAVYDGTTIHHGLHTLKPGTIAMWAWEGVPASGPAIRRGITPFHEFGHAASSFGAGLVTDLYNDDLASNGEILINKKRKPPGPPAIPMDFAIYTARTHRSDQNPQGIIPFAANGPEDRRLWSSYRPEKGDSQPVAMDNYWHAAAPEECIHDELTRAFLADRIRTKLER